MLYKNTDHFLKMLLSHIMESPSEYPVLGARILVFQIIRHSVQSCK